VDPGGDQLRAAAADDEGEAGVKEESKGTLTFVREGRARKSRAAAGMKVSVPFVSSFSIDRGESMNLQDQIRQRIVECVAVGSLAPLQRLPSTRALARHLKVSRNTVAAAYQRLVADGHLEARPRSGIYVSNARYAAIRRDELRAAGQPTPVEPPVWERQLGGSRQIGALMAVPPDWQQFPYPFVGSQLDRSLFPVAEWREASKLTLSLQEIGDWAADTANADDAKLLQEIRSKVLPRRGIHARPDEVLVTADGQQALHLTVELLIEPGTTVAVEEPGNPELVALLRRRGAEIVFQPVDRDGMVVDERLADCGVVYVSPGHQRPTGVALSSTRRAALMAMAAERDFIVVEDDFESEADDLGAAPPALRAGDQGRRVAYVAPLLQSLAPALRLGVLVAPPSLVRAARALRRITTQHPPLSMQRTAAHLLALGHYDTITARVGASFRKRLLALRDALNHYFVQLVEIPPVRGGTAYWVTGPEAVDVRELPAAAEARGVLIQPAAHFYSGGSAPRNVFRVSVSGIPEERIRPGIETLSRVFRAMLARERKPAARLACLDADELRERMPGMTILCRTVYSDPLTIELLPDGGMTGRAGFANEDQDLGRWWLEGDFWCRQWKEWSYGQVARFRIVLEGGRIHWVSPDGRFIDSGLVSIQSGPIERH
jgi:GntR family transcriptional regulator/MocR family aminotransferase